jgi:periplasmic protein TorT
MKNMRFTFKKFTMLNDLLVILSCILILPLQTYCENKAWYPADVEIWQLPFINTAQRTQKKYVPLPRAQKKWHIQVFIPHLKDAYWLGVNYGLIDQARQSGVRLSIHQAGGYGQLDVQKKQIESILKSENEKPDGVIISAISENGLNELVKKLSENQVPVIDLINGMSSPFISSRVAVSFRDMGFQAGNFISNHQKKNNKPLAVGWFPGPEGAAWVAAGDKGFKEAIKGSDIRIMVSQKGDTGSAAQSKLLNNALDSFSQKIDIIAGTAVSAEVAVNIVRKRGLKKKIKVLSYYYGPGVHRGIRRGDILAAPTDHPVLQARIAIDTMIRIIEKKNYDKHISPKVTVIDRSNIRKWDSSTTLAPRGFKPVFSINE